VSTELYIKAVFTLRTTTYDIGRCLSYDVPRSVNTA